MKTIAVSLKMYFDRLETISWVGGVADLAARRAWDRTRIILLPSATELDAAVGLTRWSRVEIGAQNVAAVESGAFTGEVSIRNLAQLGCTVVEIGHAERRRLFGEDNDTIARKASLVARAGLEPMLCVGESVQTRTEGAATACCHQLDAVLDVLPAESALTVAYEPVWAIGADRPAPIDYVNEVLARVRAHLAHRGRSATILYGGSAGRGLIGALPEADGLFLGRFAHDIGQLEAVLFEASTVASR